MLKATDMYPLKENFLVLNFCLNKAVFKRVTVTLFSCLEVGGWTERPFPAISSPRNLFLCHSRAGGHGVDTSRGKGDTEAAPQLPLGPTHTHICSGTGSISLALGKLRPRPPGALSLAGEGHEGHASTGESGTAGGSSGGGQGRGIIQGLSALPGEGGWASFPEEVTLT